MTPCCFITTLSKCELLPAEMIVPAEMEQCFIHDFIHQMEEPLNSTMLFMSVTHLQVPSNLLHH